jgi:hypothetical protein
MGSVFVRRNLSFATLALAGLALVAPRDARACKVLTVQGFTADPARQATDQQAPMVTGPAVVTIRRGMVRGTDCDSTGSLTISVPVSDDQTALPEMGFRITLESGTPPAGLFLRNGDFKGAIPGVLGFGWADGASNDQESFSFVLSIAPIDAAGNVGQAVDVVVADGGSGGCAMGRAGQPRLLVPLLLLGMWLLMKTRSRWARSEEVLG